MRERWGIFSVKDHMTQAPFVSDVLLYDRLIIPTPPADKSQDDFWKKFKPKRQQDCINILNKTERLALTVPWDTSKRERFKNRMSTAAALATQQRSPEHGYYFDPFEATRQLIKDEFRPELPPGVVLDPWTVAAYTSKNAYQQDVAVADPDKHRRLAALITHRFLTPAGGDPSHKLLEEAVKLATTDDFRRKRSRFYEFQERIIEERIPDEQAIKELERRLQRYNEVIETAFRSVCNRFVYTLIPIALPMIASVTLVAKDPTTLVVTGIAGLCQLARFWKFDRNLRIDAGDLDAAAMIHDARQNLSFQ